MALIIIGGSYFFFDTLYQYERNRIQHSLSAIADLKVSQITGWIRQNRDTANVAAKGSSLATRAKRWFGQGMPGNAEADGLRHRLEFLRSQYSLREIVLLDAGGKPVMTTDNTLHGPLAIEPAILRRALESNQPVPGEMHWERKPDGTPYISLPLAVSLTLGDERGRSVGFLWIELDVDHFLFPLIQSWPSSSTTAETILVRRNGDDVIFQNALRHQEDTALKLRLSADHPDRLVARAVRGETGFMIGIDYRSEPVIGYALAVPETDWHLVAKIDSAEVYEPIRRMAVVIVAGTLVLLFVSSLLLYVWWRGRNARFREAQLQLQLRQQRLSRQFDYLSKYASDIILLLDSDGNIVEANDRAETAYGLQRRKLIGRNIRELRAPAERGQLESQWWQPKTTGSMLFEGHHLRSDGSLFPVEINSGVIQTAQGTFVQSIIRDITERKAAQARENRLTNIHRALSATNEAIIHADSEASLLPLVCRIAVESGGMKTAWIGIPDKDGCFVPSASDGETGFLGEIMTYTSSERPEGRGPSGIAFRQGRPVVTSDFSEGGVLGPWRDVCAKYGIRAVATFPIRRGGKPYGVWGVYSGQTDVFDDEIVRLLGEMADNISFALDNFDREALRTQAETALRDSERRFRNLYEKAPLPYQSLDIEGNILDVNEKWLSILGYERDEVIGRFFGDFVAETSITQPAMEFPRFKLQGRIEGAPFEMICKDGCCRAWVVNGQIARDSEGNFLRTHCIFTDVTEQKKAEEELKLAAMVYQDSSEAMMIMDVSENIIAVNPAFEHITGFAADDVIGQSVVSLLSGMGDRELYSSIEKTIQETGYWRGEIWSRRKDGELFAASVTINTNQNPDGSVNRRVMLFSDITEKKKSEDRIWMEANFDALTGLPNRRLFRDRLRHEIRNARRSNQPLALMFLDLDGFKDVNDTLGHDAGDLLLKEAARRLNGCVRESDTVARLGGDEFTVILTDMHDPNHIDRVARHILRMLSEPFLLDGETAYVSASIGITLFPQDAGEFDGLIRNADQAMYAAKQSGKNQYHYYTQSMQEAAQQRMRLVNDLRLALEGRQFEIAYQPIVELATGRVHKAEALIRWNHPVRGMINPVEFISAAEDTGMIASFGNWIFHEAARQAAIWREAYSPDFQISVNISPVQFKKEGIDPSVWLDHLRSLGLPGQGIVVEITEGLLLDASPKVTGQLLMLRDAGIEVALDDFGTGYSSLSYLKKFDIDYIKIDQTFVRNLTAGSDDMALCEAIIVMAHKLGLEVIAEGVETEEHRSLLLSAGCDFAQGYLFSRPVESAEFEVMLAASGKRRE